MIFSDKTLVELATWFPHSKKSFLAIHGIGESKLEKFGETFLNIIKSYCLENSIQEIPRPQFDSFRSRRSVPSRRSIPLSSTGSPMQFNNFKPKRHSIVGAAYNNGKSVSELMREFNVKQQTILAHLYKYQMDGNNILRTDELMALSTLTDPQKKAVCNTFKTLGTEALSPVFEAFNKTIPYEDLHILRLCMGNRS